MKQKMTAFQKAIMAEIRHHNANREWLVAYNDGLRFVSMGRYEDFTLKEFDETIYIGEEEISVSKTRYRVTCRFNPDHKLHDDADTVDYMVIVQSDGRILPYFDGWRKSK